MKLVQIGSNKGNDDLAKFLKKNYEKLDFALFVEANPLHIWNLKDCYKQYSNVFIENIAVKDPSYEKDFIEIFYHTKDGPNYECASFDPNHVIRHANSCPHLAGGEIKSFTVSCITVEDLFEKYNIKELDWLLLDVEGLDSELLLDTNWNKYDIKRIEYESLHLGKNKEKIENIFKNLGYVKSVSLHPYDDCWTKKSLNGNKKMNVTLYAISKNEEKNVEKFIENSKKFSHTVVVDTGSTDNTVQLLRDAGITVYEHPQTREEFDFSAARNQALSYVETDWAFSIDFNEEISELFVDGLEVIAEEFTTFKHQRYDKTEGEESKPGQTAHVRFHRTKNYIWTNAVHETPMFIPTEKHLNEVSVETTIKITKEVEKHNIDKQLFYLSICEREFKKDPSNTYFLWFIFKHYYEVKNFKKTIELGKEYLNISKPYFDPTRIDVFVATSVAMINLQDIQIAANYAFHAVSEAMNIGGDSMGKAFIHLLEIGKLTQNPNIVVFASAFAQETLNLKERTDAIDKLFLTNLDDTPATAWTGHRMFAEWIVKYLNPKVIVDLGVDYGYSTLSFAIPRIGHVYGIDNFSGDDFVGEHISGKYNYVMMKREKLHLKDNLTIIEGDFNEIAQTWDKQIDILHIDGSHHYEDVKKDFETWTKFLNDDGVILLHDTCIENLNGNEYGVKKFFDEIDLPKCTFTHCYGLGIVSKNEKLIEMIKTTFNL